MFAYLSKREDAEANITQLIYETQTVQYYSDQRAFATEVSVRS